MLRVMIRLVADAVLVAILLFLAAGTVVWRRAWVLLALLLLVRASLPIHKEQGWTDRILLLGVLATGFLGLPIIAGLDAFRWHAMPRPAPPLADLGLVLFALGWSIKSLALRAHAVADSGPYGVVRHPFYAADPLILVGPGLWLEAYVAVLGAVVPIALMVMRLRAEERFLRRALPGYTAYAERVRFRLIPGVW